MLLVQCRPAQGVQPSSMHKQWSRRRSVPKKHIRRHSLQSMHSIYTAHPAESVPAATKEACEGRSNFPCHTRMQQHKPNHFNITLSPANHPFITLRQPLHRTQGWPHAVRALPDHIRIQTWTALVQGAASKVVRAGASMPMVAALLTAMLTTMAAVSVCGAAVAGGVAAQKAAAGVALQQGC